MMRHAKAEPFAATDHERRLTDRGRSSARDVGAHLRDAAELPDYALVSSAVRTRETWAELVEASGTTCEPAFDDAVFTGSPDVVLEALRAVPDDARTVLFLGHNPTASYVCHLLDDGEGDPAATSEMLTGFPPAAVATLEVTVSWAELAPETARVTGFYVGT